MDPALLRSQLYKAACEARVDTVSLLSTYFIGDVDTLSVALNLACEYGQLNVVTWLVEHTVVCNDGRCLGWALRDACTGSSVEYCEMVGE
jgi:hypothetical protein